MFTPGQKSRMRAVLLSGAAGRNNLWTNSNHTATGLNQTPTLCAVDIRSSRDVVCGGDDVEFFDESYNNVNSWSWVFPGGSPSTSTQQNRWLHMHLLGLMMYSFRYLISLEINYLKHFQITSRLLLIQVF